MARDLAFNDLIPARATSGKDDTRQGYRKLEQPRAAYALEEIAGKSRRQGAVVIYSEID